MKRWIFIFFFWSKFLFSGVSGQVDLDFSLDLSTDLIFGFILFGNFFLKLEGLKVYIASGILSLSFSFSRGYNLIPRLLGGLYYLELLYLDFLELLLLLCLELLRIESILPSLTKSHSLGYLSLEFYLESS